MASASGVNVASPMAARKAVAVSKYHFFIWHPPDLGFLRLQDFFLIIGCVFFTLSPFRREKG
jgi:hypothetical protein